MIIASKFLKLVGIREDYNLDSEKEIYKFNLCLNNKLNILVVEIDLLNSIENYFIRSLISFDLENSCLIYKTLDSYLNIDIKSNRGNNIKDLLELRDDISIKEIK